MSRSQLYAQALAEFLQTRSSSAVTAKLNGVYDLESSAVEPDLVATQLQLLSDATW